MPKQLSDRFKPETIKPFGDADDALRAFTNAIDATGGAVKRADGLHVLVEDEDWVDLAEAYVAACYALGRKPRIDNV